MKYFHMKYTDVCMYKHEYVCRVEMGKSKQIFQDSVKNTELFVCIF